MRKLVNKGATTNIDTVNYINQMIIEFIFVQNKNIPIPSKNFSNFKDVVMMWMTFQDTEIVALSTFS